MAQLNSDDNCLSSEASDSYKNILSTVTEGMKNA